MKRLLAIALFLPVQALALTVLLSYPGSGQVCTAPVFTYDADRVTVAGLVCTQDLVFRSDFGG